MTKRQVSYKVSSDRVAIRGVRERLALPSPTPTGKQANKSVSVRRRVQNFVTEDK
ncbi:MAG: hypothetical protein RMX65_018115 [Nostoc sp. DedQUE01]|nr:hypothetical protein [Nostoc sp. DedQUE01]